MITLAFVAVALVAIYLYATRTFKYWQVRGVKHDKPIPFFGNNILNLLMKKSVTQVVTDLYWKYPDEKIVGFYRSSQPELLIRDPEIAKRILTTDFLYFYPRGLNPSKKVIEPLLKNLFFADGDLWRLLRQRISPLFSSGRLRAMFPLISERAEKLKATIATLNEKNNILDARELMARYTTDFIGAVGFGLDTDALSDEKSEFRKLGIKIFQITIPLLLITLFKEVFPEATRRWKYTYRVEKEIMDLVNVIQRQRNYEPSGRNDFIDLLMESKKKGTIIGESIEKVKPDGTPEQATLEMDDELLAAQVFVFFAAGFETSSSATSFTLNQLAFHSEVQNKVQTEIDRVVAKYDNKLCYDAIKEMTYLEMVFHEGMRMFPSLGFLIRESTRTYTFPEINVTIGPEVVVIIPLQAMHNDPQYFDDPQKFRPERFHPDECGNIKKNVYMPFGEGPRACVGARLGLMQSLAGLAAVLSRYTVEPAPGSLRQPIVDPSSNIVQGVKGGIPLIFKERR